MTNEQRTLFSSILELNSEVVQLKDKLFLMEDALENLKNELEESMGTDAYNTFMNNGRKMFAPKED